MGEYALDVSQGNDKGLMAPLYVNAEKDLYLFSHHPMGLVWQVSTKLSMTPLRGIFDDASKVGQACPDKESIRWQWFNSTTPNGQQIYIEDDNIHVKCVERIRNWRQCLWPQRGLSFQQYTPSIPTCSCKSFFQYMW